jgi:DNA polymerase-3 subunit beta
VKFLIEQSRLNTAIATVAGAVERRNTIPILSNVLVTAAKGTITLVGTDLDLEIAVEAQATTIQEGSTTISAATLRDIARKLPAGAEIEFAMDKEGQAATLKSGRSRFNLYCLPASDFPRISTGDFSHNFVMTGEAVVGLLEKVQFAISTEETRFYLNGIYFHTADDAGPKLRAVATDGHRLGRHQIDAVDGSEGMPGVIIPKKAVAQILSLADGVKEPVEISISDTKIRFGLPGVTFVSKLIDGTFPDYDRVIPRGNNKIALVDSKTLAQATDRVTTLSSERGRAVKFSIEPGQITLAVNNPDAGAAVDQIDANFEGEPIDVGFNARYVADVLSVLGAGEIRIAMEDNGSPTVFTSDKAVGFLAVLMPLRV